ncbi:MAG: hypothetical protein JXA28_00175 [Bacteroidetes bacterium]|nr:hypothetical protein [Bacteroidota bacterium]
MKNILAFLAVALLLTACGGEETQQQAQDQTGQTRGTRVNIPLAEDQDAVDDEIPPAGRIPAEELPDLSGLPEVERDVFMRTIQIQHPYYQALEKWADAANEITEGEAAATALRRYISLQDQFARRMQTLDIEFSGKLDPDYAGSAEFSRVVDAYMNGPKVMRQTEYIMQSYMSLIQRFRDDPACKDVFAELDRLARESQE